MSAVLNAKARTPCYAEGQYWETRYQCQPTEFDWFYGWSAVRKLVYDFIPKHKSCLHVGCGNSNLQGGMGRAGYQVTNVDISHVVLEQMQQKHADMPNLEYVCADCRDMPCFRDCSFASAIDKGTLDALLCSQEGLDNVRRMLSEISRVLQPGAVLLEISLGDPMQRLPLLCQPQYKWSVSVCLLPRADLRNMVQLPGRTLPTNDTLKPVKYLGPYSVDAAQMLTGGPTPESLGEYFYAYVCRKEKLVLKSDSRVALPPGWKDAAREAADRLQKQLGLSQDLLAVNRGRAHARRQKQKDKVVTPQGSQQHISLAELLMQCLSQNPRGLSAVAPRSSVPTFAHEAPAHTTASTRTLPRTTTTFAHRQSQPHLRESSSDPNLGDLASRIDSATARGMRSCLRGGRPLSPAPSDRSDHHSDHRSDHSPRSTSGRHVHFQDTQEEGEHAHSMQSVHSMQHSSSSSDHHGATPAISSSEPSFAENQPKSCEHPNSEQCPLSGVPGAPQSGIPQTSTRTTHSMHAPCSVSVAAAATPTPTPTTAATTTCRVSTAEAVPQLSAQDAVPHPDADSTCMREEHATDTDPQQQEPHGTTQRLQQQQQQQQHEPCSTTPTQHLQQQQQQSAIQSPTRCNAAETPTHLPSPHHHFDDHPSLDSHANPLTAGTPPTATNPSTATPPTATNPSTATPPKPPPLPQLLTPFLPHPSAQPHTSTPTNHPNHSHLCPSEHTHPITPSMHPHHSHQHPSTHQHTAAPQISSPPQSQRPLPLSPLSSAHSAGGARCASYLMPTINSGPSRLSHQARSCPLEPPAQPSLVTASGMKTAPKSSRSSSGISGHLCCDLNRLQERSWEELRRADSLEDFSLDSKASRE